jgi:predicted DCC family thiol-disulfide oxidoreductase YuxK
MGNDTPLTESTLPYPILFFDGECVLCNRATQLLIQVTAGSTLHFASLQGSSAKLLLGSLSQTTNSLIYWNEGHTSFEKDAIVNALSHVSASGWGTIRQIVRLLPKAFVNSLYQMVSRNRFNWFGKTECWINNDRFLG